MLTKQWLFKHGVTGMNIMKVRCPECGEIVSADIDKAAAICEICGAPFVTKDAIKAIQEYEGKSRGATHPKVEEYLTSAKRALDNGLYDNAKMYYWKAAEYAPDNWEATFYKAFVEYIIIINNRASNSVNYYNTDAYLNDINKKANDVYNAIKVVVEILKSNNAVAIGISLEEIYERLLPYFHDNKSIKWYIASRNFNNSIKINIFYHDYCLVSSKMFLYLGNVLEEMQNRDKESQKAMLKYWETGVEILKDSYGNPLVDLFDIWDSNSVAKKHIKLTQDFYDKAVTRIKKYDKSYTAPELGIDKTSSKFTSHMIYWSIVSGIFVVAPLYNWKTSSGFTAFFLGVVLFISIPSCTLWLLFILYRYISRKI